MAGAHLQVAALSSQKQEQKEEADEEEVEEIVISAPPSKKDPKEALRFAEVQRAMQESLPQMQQTLSNTSKKSKRGEGGWVWRLLPARTNT